MTDAEKRNIIIRLYEDAQCEESGASMDETELTDVMLSAAAALEATLWKPIEEMPDELKDGRAVFVWRPELEGIHNAHADSDRWNGNSWQESWRDAQPTHYMEITAPEVE